MLVCKGRCIYQQGIVSVIPISSLMKNNIKLKIIVYSMVLFPLKLNRFVCSFSYNVTKRHVWGFWLLATQKPISRPGW